MSEGERYVTPPGVDEREIDYPPYYTPEEIEEFKRKGIKFIKWRGWALPTGPGCSTWFYDEISHRLRHNKSVVVLFTGPPGSGKTYAAMRLAQIFDPKFDPDKQVCFSRLEVYDILSGKRKLRRGQIIILDEAHISIGARSFSTPEQRELVELLAAARSKGYGMFIIALHQQMIDIIVRNFMSVFMIVMNKPGYGDLYHLYTPRFENRQWRKKLPPLYFELPDAELCDSPDCLSCPYRERCMTIRARYERKKDAFLTELARQAREKAKEKLEKAQRPTDKEAIEILISEADKVKFGPKGGIIVASIQNILSRHGYKAGITKARELWMQAVQKAPWIAKKRGEG